MFKHKTHKDSGNALVIVLAVVLLVAAGGVFYYMQNKDESPGTTETASMSQMDDMADTEDTAEPAAGENAKANSEDDKMAQEDGAEGGVVKPGNPVVAKVDDTPVTRMDVFNYIQTLPENAKQVPVQQLFPMAQEQVINAAIINEKTEDVNYEDDPEYQEQLKLVKKNITRSLYLKRQVDERLTEKRLKKAYNDYKDAFPRVDEVNARHILVDSKEKAEELIKKLEDGAEFEMLAKENSKDGTAANGGSVGWFAKEDVVPEFADAAFAMKEGAYTKEPVKSDFGWHVIEVVEKRKRPVPEYAQVKPFLEPQIRREILDELMDEWRDDAKIVRYDINGDPIEPAAGDK